MWVVIDVGNVIYRSRTKETLPELRGPYPGILLWLARLFVLIGLASILSFFIARVKLSQWLFWPLYWVGPFFIIIADRLMGGLSRWRIFAIILLVFSLAQPLLLSFFIVFRLVSFERSPSISGLLFYIAQVVFIVVSLIILFLPPVRFFFRESQPNPGATIP